MSNPVLLIFLEVSALQDVFIWVLWQMNLFLWSLGGGEMLFFHVTEQIFLTPALPPR